jgi:hypothetical protein
MNVKRLIIATLGGIVFGFVCLGFASSGPYDLPAPVAYQIIFSRALIGFAIGISGLKGLHWSLHGLLMGLLFSIPMAFSGMMADNPDFSKTAMFLSTVIMGMIYGLLIELITSVLFKARI